MVKQFFICCYFFARYTQGCKATIIARNGTITSPAFGLEHYPSNQECLYKIRNPIGGPLSLNFNDFDVDKSDFIQVFDGSTTSGLRWVQNFSFRSYFIVIFPDYILVTVLLTAQDPKSP